MISSILVATDGSHHGHLAVRQACELARRFDAHVVILHAALRESPAEEVARVTTLQRLLEPQPEEPLHTDELIARLAAAGLGEADNPVSTLEAIDGRILEAAQQEAERAGLSGVAVRLTEGSPAADILAHARFEGADLVVVGSRGLGPLRGMLLGSVSREVCQKAPCSCMVVR